MTWNWKKEPLDPETTTLEQMAAAGRLHHLGSWIGAVVGIIAAIVIYSVWDSFGYEKKWVEYTLFPAVVIGGILFYRLVYEIVIRFRP
jgi:hypothetical protein